MENNDKIYTEQVLGLALDLGKSMVKCGAEMNRVEDTVIRVGHAYKMKSTEVFSVVSMITATVTDENGRTHTQTRRMYSYSVNFEKLERLNAFSRKICRETPDVEQARKELEEISASSKPLGIFNALGHVVAASAFSVFFGGTFKDALATVPIAIFIYLMNTFVKVSGASKLFFTAFTGAVSGAMALIFVRVGIGDNADMIMIGAVMLSIPGLMLINSVREMLCGDLMSGILRLLESVILALAIACGFAIPIYLGG